MHTRNLLSILLISIAMMVPSMAIAQSDGGNKKKKKKANTEQTIIHSNNKALSGIHSGHEWVDLGLPSGTKWATSNIDAESPYELGNYYRRSETYPAKIGVFETTKDYSVNVPRLKWGGRWRLPTQKEITELTTKCKITVDSKGKNWIYKITGPNNKYILLIAGDDFLWDSGAPRDRGYDGEISSVCYLSSSFYMGNSTNLVIDYDVSSNKISYKG